MTKILILFLITISTSSAFASDIITAKAAQAHVQIEYFEGALFNFISHAGRLPTLEEGLVALIQRPNNETNWKGPYLQSNKIPKDPWSQDYVYKIQSGHFQKPFLFIQKE